MGLVSFFTIYDDELNRIFTHYNCEKYDLNPLYAYYKADSLSALDNFNVNSLYYLKSKKSGSDMTEPTIPANVIKYYFERDEKYGFLSTFLICPNSKWSPFYKNGVHAVKNLNRKAKRENDYYFKPVVIDSRAFGFGSVLLAFQLAKLYCNEKLSTSLLLQYAERYARSSATYILTVQETICGKVNGLSAFRIKDTRIFPIELGDSYDEIKYDKFVKTVVSAVIRSNSLFAVSCGAECDFASNIIGRFMRDYKLYPIDYTRFSVPSTHLFGTKTLCIHMGEYIDCCGIVTKLCK